MTLQGRGGAPTGGRAEERNMLRPMERIDGNGGRYRNAPAPEPTDEALMCSIAADDPRGLELLMDRHWVPLMRFVVRSLDGWDEAEDVVQDVFVRVWRARTSWQADGSIRAYLHRIARNLVIDAGRHRRVREKGGDLPLRRRRTPTPAEEAIRGELQEDLERALSGLAPRRREAFVLVRLQGMTLKEAGDVMELTPRTVANHVYLAATDLAEALSAHLS